MKEDQKIVIYQTPDGKTQIDVRLENETVWLTQAQMAELFEKDQSVVARHINNAFKEGELEKESNMHFLHNTQYKYRPTLFLWFLNNNGILYREDGSKRLADNTLVALTLMIAESKTEEKDVMVKVVVNLINQKNE